MQSSLNDALIVGADSRIGSALLERLRSEGKVAWGTTRRTGSAGLLYLDLGHPEQCLELRNYHFNVAFICAAISSIEKCLNAPELTTQVNVYGTQKLCQLLSNSRAHVVFLSTNHVFDGTSPRVQTDAEITPLSEYGRQKAQVEQFLRSNLENYTIVRLTKVIEPHSILLERWVKELCAGSPIKAVTDLRLSPIPLNFVVDVLVEIMHRKPKGIIHISAEEEFSYADIAHRIAERIGVSLSLVHPTTMSEVGLDLYPPDRYTTLATTRLRDELGLSPPPAWDTIDSALSTIGLNHL